MRKMLVVFPVLLGACSTAPAPAETPVHGETPGHTCTQDGTDQFVGQNRSDAVGAQIEQVSHAAVLRWAPPGIMLTMDFRADRVTVWLDAADKITKIRCG
jgi:hypothetical protein